MPSLNEMIGYSFDLMKLARLGIYIDCDDESHTEDSEQVKLQDYLAASFWKQTVHQLRTHASSFLWHTEYYPGCLAPLLSEDADIRTAHE